MDYSGPVQSLIPEKLGFEEHGKQLDEEGFENQCVQCSALPIYDLRRKGNLKLVCLSQLFGIASD